MPFRPDPGWRAPQTPETAYALAAPSYTCERVRQCLGSGSYFARRLNPKRESGVRHFHELYRQALREQAPRT